MKIRTKVVLLVLPLIIAPLLLTGFIASLSARNGITSIATSFLRFKMDDLVNYANSQWSLLVENGLVGKQEFVDAARTAVSSYARTLVRGETELIFAMDSKGQMTMRTAEVTLSPEETAALQKQRETGGTGWIQIAAGGVPRVAQTASFAPFDWYLLVTEKRDTFYRITSQIFMQTALILAVSLAAAGALLFVFSHLLTQPLRLVGSAMREIMATSDLSRRVEILYRDETGELGHSFNLMTEALDKAYQQIKDYAFKAVVAQHKEQKIRNIFQKYVPPAVIEEFFSNPESMLVGKDRVLAVLFSDIRDFTRISEPLTPSDVVESLNAYFRPMVDSIVNNDGIVDKYMGDAILALFGATVDYPDKAYKAVLAGLEMLRELDSFNRAQTTRGREAFKIGIGINYGVVTVGNIGHREKKMDYTVIGDGVNLASRIEGLTKVYRENLLVSESVVRKLEARIPARLLDRVAVKGKTSWTGIYAVRRVLSPRETEAWRIHEESLALYYKREFPAAQKGFREVMSMLAGDVSARQFAERSAAYIKTPPADEWTGAILMKEK
jgi:adenylate cyclase